MEQFFCGVDVFGEILYRDGAYTGVSNRIVILEEEK